VPPSAASDGVLGHESTVVGLAAADGGRVVVSGSGDGVLKVWDVRSGALLRTISDDRADADPPPTPWESPRLPTWGGERGPLLAGFAGSRQVVASAGSRLSVWDLDRGTRLHVLDDKPSRGEHAGALATTADGRYVVSTPGGSLRIWDQETGTVRWVAGNRVTTLAFAGSDRVISGSSHLDTGQYGQYLRSNALRVWDLATGQQIRTLEGRPCGVNALTATSDGRFVASAPNPGLYMFQDARPRLWDVDTGEQLQAFDGHTHTVTAVAITPDQRLLLSGGGNCFQRYDPEFTVKLWDSWTGELRRSFDGHQGPVVTVLVTPDSRWAVSAGGTCLDSALTRAAGPYYPKRTYDGSIRVWDLVTETLAATFQGDDAATCMVLPNRDTVVAGSLNGAVHILRFDR